MSSILSGYRVIELAGVLAGPSTGQFLAELGAEVIKVENLLTGGDVTRKWRTSNENSESDVTAYFSSANWGKKSIAINLNTPEGKEIIYRLIQESEIVISSYKKGDDQKLGMDVESLLEYNPTLIYARITGYGPDVAKVAYDAVLQAESGFMSMNGTKESGPLKMPVALIDILAAHQLKEAILAAVIKKLKTAKGSVIEVSLMDSAVVSLANQATNYLFTRISPELQGSEHPNIAPYGETFETLDGEKVILAVGTDKQFKELCIILSIDSSEKYSTNKQRLKNRKALYILLNEKIALQNADTFLDECEKRNVPAGKVKTLQEVMSENEKLIYKSENKYGLMQNVFETQKSTLTAPPHLGEHSKEIVISLGKTPETVEEWVKKNIISYNHYK